MAASRRTALTRNRRGALLIAAGTAAGQAITVLSSPVLSRLYGPTEFATFSIISSIAAILTIISAGRLELTVPLVDSDRGARGAVQAAMGLCLIVTSAFTLLAVPLSDGVARLLQHPDLGSWLWVAPLIGGTGCACVILNQWAIRRQAFGSIGARSALRPVAVVASQVLLGVGGAASGLITGLAAGNVAGVLAMLPGSALRAKEFVPNWGTIRGLLEKHRSLVMLMTMGGLLNVLGTQLPILLFSTHYSSAEVGWLGLTQRVLTLPAGLIGTAVASVYLAVLAEAHRSRGTIEHIFVSTSRRLALIAGFAAAILVIGGPRLFPIVFGADWRNAGVYAQWLALGVAAQLISVPVSQTLIVLGQTKRQFLWDLGRCIAVNVCMAIPIASNASAATAVACLGMSLAVTYALQWYLSWRAVLGWTGVFREDQDASD